MGEAAQLTFGKTGAATTGIERDNLRVWDFGDVPGSIVFTKSGFSARVVAARRPGVPIVVLTDQARTYRQLALVWGVVPFLVPHADTYEQMLAQAREVLVKHNLATPGQQVIITAGVPFDVPGTTNTMKVETV